MKVWKKNMLIAAGGLLAVGVIFCGIGPGDRQPNQ